MPIPYNPGDTIRQYRIVQKLSEGNYANGYEATVTGTGRRIFLKQYGDPTELLGDVFIRFVNQQRQLKQLLDGVDEAETIYETFEENGIHHQAKEFMLGRDLRSYFGERPSLPLEERRLIAAVSVYALIKVHEKGIIHNDLKPEQIFLREDSSIKMKYRVKLTDFDFSTVKDHYDPVYKVTTPFYSSPEYLLGYDTSEASDVFTMGIVLYEILTGDVPYTATDPDEYKEQVLEYRARKPREINPSLSEPIDVLWGTLNPDPSKRPPLQELHGLLLQPIPVSTAPHPAPPSPTTVKVPIRLELVCDGVPIPVSVHKSSVIGRNECRVFPSYQYLANEQFELEKGIDQWTIKGRTAANRTFLNGEDISDKVLPIRDGDEIFIGNFDKQIGLKLRVRCIYA